VQQPSPHTLEQSNEHVQASSAASHMALPQMTIFVTKPSMQGAPAPHSETASKASESGKSKDDSVYPVTQMLPLVSTATPFPSSAPLPPKYEDHAKVELAASTLVTNASTMPRLVSKPPGVGKSADAVSPVR